MVAPEKKEFVFFISILLMSADSVKLFLIIVSLNYILFYLTEIYFHMKFLFIYLFINVFLGKSQ